MVGSLTQSPPQHRGDRKDTAQPGNPTPAGQITTGTVVTTSTTTKGQATSTTSVQASTTSPAPQGPSATSTNEQDQSGDGSQGLAEIAELAELALDGEQAGFERLTRCAFHASTSSRHGPRHESGYAGRIRDNARSGRFPAGRGRVRPCRAARLEAQSPSGSAGGIPASSQTGSKPPGYARTV